MPIVEVENVSKIFRARRRARALLGREGLGRLFTRSPRPTFTALEDITLSVEAGETLGIIGQNGSGKSTLLKLIAGVTVPTTGRVTVRGRVASLLELGAGFHPVLTGRENVYLNAGLLGMRHAQVDEVFDQIADFAGIGDYIDHPVDTYSSGMYVRLAFSVAVHTDPDIFLVDEVLAVGDEEFQRKCRRRIGELKEQGKTILFVSHDLGIVNTLCDRVLLLHRGRSIVRGTPRETVEYYLRMVGGAEGVHVFEGRDVEAIASHGRISVFHGGREVSAPAGFRVVLRSMEQDHDSGSAAWTMESAGPDGCVARGRLARVPAAHRWDLRFDGTRLIWRLGLECERDVPIEWFEARLMLPSVYDRWIYGDLEGPFPEIRPEDVTGSAVVTPEVTCDEAAALAPPGDPRPPVRVRLEPHRPHLRMAWFNSDYIGGARVLSVGARIPDSEQPVRAGRHDIMTLEIELGDEPEAVRRQVRADRTVHSGPLTARFEQGRLRLAWDGEELTSFIHVYASILAGGLWNDSLSLQWGPVSREGEAVIVAGHSRRFPFVQHWRVEPEGTGIAVRIELEALEGFDVSEYHFSAVLRPEYDRWVSDREEGEFPDFVPGREDWRHFNRDYAPGTSLRALSPTLPSVTLEVSAGGPPFRPTALNTGYSPHARVLQMLRTADAGVLRFEPGRHLYFAGVLRVEPREDSPE